MPKSAYTMKGQVPEDTGDKECLQHIKPGIPMNDVDVENTLPQGRTLLTQHKEVGPVHPEGFWEASQISKTLLKPSG